MVLYGLACDAVVPPPPPRSASRERVELGVCASSAATTLLTMKRIAILGSTGSIGRSMLSVAESYPERFQIVTLAAGSNLEVAFEQARRWRPQVISMAAEA